MAKGVGKMRFEYLQVYLDDYERWVAFDGSSICDGDESLLALLNRLGLDRWEYIGSEQLFLFLKRSLP